MNSLSITFTTYTSIIAFADIVLHFCMVLPETLALCTTLYIAHYSHTDTARTSSIHCLAKISIPPKATLAGVCVCVCPETLAAATQLYEQDGCLNHKIPFMSAGWLQPN